MTTDTRNETEQTTTREVVDRKAWSPAQLLAGAAGLLLIVMGGVAVARAGFDGGLTGDAVSVFGFGHTALWGLIELVIGLLFAGAAAGPFEAKRSLGSLGALSLAFGLIVLIEPGAFADVLGFDEATGGLYTAIGAVSLLVAWWSPTYVVDRRREQSRHG